jgi:anti-anti-sigma factor
MSQFSLQRINQGEVQVVAISGYMGNDEFHRLDNELERVQQERCRGVILDCSALTFITSLSLARLLLVTQLFRRHGCEFRLAGLSSSASKTAQAIGFDSKLELQPNVTTAIKSMRKGAASKPNSRPKRKK